MCLGGRMALVPILGALPIQSLHPATHILVLTTCAIRWMLTAMVERTLRRHGLINRTVRMVTTGLANPVLFIRHLPDITLTHCHTRSHPTRRASSSNHNHSLSIKADTILRNHCPIRILQPLLPTMRILRSRQLLR